MDNNNPVVQATYASAGEITHSSSSAAGRAEAALGYQQCAPPQINETLDSFHTRQAAFDSAKQSSGN